jgi:uncharacterized membrane protein YbhN (UPF0104 family)
MNWKKLWRPLLVPIIIIATLYVFIHYIVSNQSVRHRLSHLPLSLILLLLFMYLLVLVVIGLINVATLRLCSIKPQFKEIWLITAYTAVVNFFGPLQSGPAVRAVYLKKKYDLNLKVYATASIVYYLMYAFFSGLFLLSGLLKWWLAPLSILGFGLLYLVSKHKKIRPMVEQIDLKNWYYLAFATFVQVCLMAVIYYIEVRFINPHIRLNQAIIYTGASNFALFVSITPGAIGFRESFLIFSRRLHHITSAVIVAANIIDRGVYIIFLLIIAALIFLTHANNYLNLKKTAKQPPKTKQTTKSKPLPKKTSVQ